MKCKLVIYNKFLWIVSCEHLLVLCYIKLWEVYSKINPIIALKYKMVMVFQVISYWQLVFHLQILVSDINFSFLAFQASQIYLICFYASFCICILTRFLSYKFVVSVTHVAYDMPVGKYLMSNRQEF